MELENQYWGPWLAESLEHATIVLVVVGWSSMLGVETN